MVVVMASSLVLSGSRGRIERMASGARARVPHLPTQWHRRNWHLLRASTAHAGRGCRASQGRFPPPLWIRGYAVGRYGGHPTSNVESRARNGWRHYARARVARFREPPPARGHGGRARGVDWGLLRTAAAPAWAATWQI